MLRLIFLVITICSDGFAASAALGGAGVKIPIRSAFMISLTGTFCFGLPVYSADFLCRFIPEWLCGAASCLLLIFLGIMNIFGDEIKAHSETKSPVKLFFDGTAADADRSKTLSIGEAFFLSLALSADSFVAGISAGLDGTSPLLMLAVTFAAGFSAVMLGAYVGGKISAAGNLKMNRACGIMLIILALWGFFR